MCFGIFKKNKDLEPHGVFGWKYANRCPFCNQSRIWIDKHYEGNYDQRGIHRKNKDDNTICSPVVKKCNHLFCLRFPHFHCECTVCKMKYKIFTALDNSDTMPLPWEKIK